MAASSEIKRVAIKHAAARLVHKLTVDEICDDLGVSRRTFYEWRMKGTGPKCTKLPNGELRVTEPDYQRWLDALKEVA
jgi:predicted site-specific integrase-resolvase